MKTTSLYLRAASFAVLTSSLTGCGSTQNETATADPKPQQAGRDDDKKMEEQQASFAKLSAEDRPLAAVQGCCAVTWESLGSMGPPLKLLINDKPVFVCCKGCEKKAKSNPDKTLAKVAELKTKVKSESHN